MEKLLGFRNMQEKLKKVFLFVPDQTKPFLSNFYKDDAT